MTDLHAIMLTDAEASSLGVSSGLYRASTVARAVEGLCLTATFAVIGDDGEYLGEIDRRYRSGRERRT